MSANRKKSVFVPAMLPQARTGSAETAFAARDDATPKAPAMTDRIWDIYAEGAFTPEQVCARLEAEDGCRVLLTSVRARICGLHKAGRLIDSGQRGLGESNKSKAIIWRRTTPAEFAEHLAKEAAND